MFMLHQIPGARAPGVAATFTSVTQAGSQIAVEKSVSKYMPYLQEKTNWEGVRKSVAVFTLKGILSKK